MSGSKTCTVDYQKVIVKKPWGYEYLMFQNDAIGIWYLHIKHGQRTSLHCHPRKKTGLVLLSGEAVVSFLNDSVRMKALSKLMIRSGLFHSTAAVCPKGIAVIEVETPPDKVNLVRLEDEYGRKEEPYEGADAQIPIVESCIRLDPPEKGRQFNYSIHGCLLTIEKAEDLSTIQNYSGEDIIVVLEGGLLSRDGEPIVVEGDVVTKNTLIRLAENFSAPDGISFLVIRKE